jgi:DNA-binding transcriptional MocR family regulator
MSGPGGQPGLVDLSGPQASWPRKARRLWRDATARALACPDSWHPAPVQGERCLRDVLGAILQEDAEQVVITSGVRAAAATLIAPGERTILHERPSFTGTVTVLRSRHPGLRLMSWPELLAWSRSAGLASGKAVAWITTPCRNPDGATLSPGGWELIEAVEPPHQVVVNEVYRWFGPAMRRPGRVWLTGSLSKLAGSGAGLGWVRGPGVHSLAERQVSRPSRFWQRCWSYLLEHGVIDLFTAHTVRPAAAAAHAFATELHRITGADHRPAGALPAGTWPPFLLLPVPHASAGEVVSRLRAEGIHVGSGDDFLAPAPSIRVCFVGVPEAGARHAARRIAACLAPGPSGSGPVTGGRIVADGRAARPQHIAAAAAHADQISLPDGLPLLEHGDVVDPDGP